MKKHALPRKIRATTATGFLLLGLVLPFDGSAQAVPSPGDRIRIKQVDGTVLTGTLATFSPETIQLSIGSDDVAEVPVARITVLETSLGRQRNFGKYFGLTLAAASVAGAIIGAIAYVDTGPCSWLCIGPQTRGEYIAWGLVGGAIIGLPLGAIIGSQVREERWNRVALPAPTAPRLTIRPVIGGRVGFAGSVRVGGL
jgi:hypothetical protein